MSFTKVQRELMKQQAVEMFDGGLDLRCIAMKLSRLHNCEISHTTIWRWIQAVSILAGRKK